MKVGGTNFVGALDMNDVDREEEEGAALGGYSPAQSGRGNDNSRMVLVMGKKVVKMVKVKEDEPRLVKNVECPGLIYGARRGPIACVATPTDYSLLHLEIGGIIPLFPIASAPALPSPASEPPIMEQEEPEQVDVEEVTSPVSPAKSPRSRSRPSEGGEISNENQDESASDRVKSPVGPATKIHPKRLSSLPTRSRSDVSVNSPSQLTVKEEPLKHTRAVSTGSMGGNRGRVSSVGKTGLGRGGSLGRSSGKDSRDVMKSPSPTKQLQVPGTHSRGGSRSGTPSGNQSGSESSSYAKKRGAVEKASADNKSNPEQLKPHIVSPSPDEFFLVTGSGLTDPGVGMFVNNDGDPTRGTISFSSYPEDLVLDGGSIIALLPSISGYTDDTEGDDMRLLEIIPIQEDDDSSSARGFVEVLIKGRRGARTGITKVLGLQDMVLEAVGSRLRIEKVELLQQEQDTDKEVEPEEWEVRKSAEELSAATRISKVAGRAVVFSGKKVWRLIPTPLVVRLDSRLPPVAITHLHSNSAEAKQQRDKRRATILSVLKAVHNLVPNTELMFHEIAYIKQKCGILLLAEFLGLPREEDKRQFPVELLATENALIEGGLDPRVVVSLFPGFGQELQTGKNGVWLYAGVREVVNQLLTERANEAQQTPDTTQSTEWAGRRDILLLLRRYLSAWRQKKGFGSVSQADEKEVFWTIDAALMRCLLTIEATRSPSTTQHMAGEADVRTELYTMVDYPPSIECFDRCVVLLEQFKRLYVLSILYQSRRMSREVLQTWVRLLESGDEKIMAEFGEGENKIADYLLVKKDKDLVREYGIWLAKRNHKLGIRVFTDEKARVKWEVAEVVEIFREHAPDAMKEFVEYLIFQKKVRYLVKQALVGDIINVSDRTMHTRMSCS